jgi:hypothetical protein
VLAVVTRVSGSLTRSFIHWRGLGVVVATMRGHRPIRNPISKLSHASCTRGQWAGSSIQA